MCDNEYALSARTMEKLDTRRNPLCGCSVYRSGGRFSAFIRSSPSIRRAFANVRLGVQNYRLNSFERQNLYMRDHSIGKGRPV